MGAKERIPDVSIRYESDFAPARNSAETLDFSRVPLGQRNPQHCPHPDDAGDPNSPSAKSKRPGRRQSAGPESATTASMTSGTLSTAEWEVRKALMGHSSGEDVHSTYVHVELRSSWRPFAKLEAWFQSQAKEPQGIDKEVLDLSTALKLIPRLAYRKKS